MKTSIKNITHIYIYFSSSTVNSLKLTQIVSECIETTSFMCLLQTVIYTRTIEYAIYTAKANSEEKSMLVKNKWRNFSVSIMRIMS
jgi:hypothetical protein